MILNRDHKCFGMKRTVVAFDENAVGKLQRTVEYEQNFAPGAKFNDRILKKNILAFAFAFTGGLNAVAVALGAAEPDRNPHRSGFGKEPRQPAYEIWFESMSSGLVGHDRPRSRSLGSRVPSLPGLEELRGDPSCFIGI